MMGRSHNRQNLTNTVISNLIIKDKNYKVWDEGQKGLYLLVSKTGTKTYYVSYILPATKRRVDYKLGRETVMTPAEARKEARVKLGEVAKGVDIQQQRILDRQAERQSRSRTLGVFVEQIYLPWAKQHRKSWEGNIKRVRALFTGWFNLPLTDITVKRVTEWRTRQLAKGLKPSCINRDVNRLSGILTQAVEMGVIDESPLRGFKKLKVDQKKRIRYLSDDEEHRLRASLMAREKDLRQRRDRFNQWLLDRHKPPLERLDGEFADHVRPMVLLALNTGMRIGEIFNLQWKHIDWSNRSITVDGQGSKNGQTRHIAMTDEAYDVLRKWRKQNTAHLLVFCSPKTGDKLDNINSAWTSVRETAELYAPYDPDLHFRFHDLRHSFASHLVMEGVDLNCVRELLGHESIDMTLKYAHLAPKNKETAINALNKRLQKRQQSETDKGQLLSE
ncbi:phage integrase [Kistimonas asteriae]|uniref:phage integrase n=1 Tax=Kistimonas asteriae TaxID=517724 RepID=UPI001BACCD16|nr:tyrosine-type recombinase/integrase [Kistimonas asteriae]